MSVLAAVLANAALALAAVGYGGLLRHMLPDTRSALDRFGLIFLGGLGLTGTLLFDVGQAWYSRPAILVVLLPGVALGVKFAIDVVRRRETSPAGARVPIVPVPIVPAAIVAAVMLVTAVAGTVRPAGDMGYDSIAYHYLGPKVWLRDGVIRPVLDQSHTAFPALVEAEYGALMSLGGQRAPNFFAVLGISSLLLVAAGLSMRLGLQARGAWWVAALILTMPAVYDGGRSGFIDVIYAAFVLAAARVAFQAQRTGHYLLLGLFLGFAAGSKYTGLIAAALLLLVFLGVSLARTGRNSRNLLRGAVLAAAVLVLAGFPAYLRNWIVLGSPIYPPPEGLARFCHVKYLSPAAIHAFNDYIRMRGAGLGHGLLSLLLLPWNLTYHTANFNGAGGIGVAPLALAPLGFLCCLRDRFAQALAFFGLLLTLAWFFTDQESRFLIHVYTIGAILSVAGWQYARRAAPRFGPALAALVIALSVCYGLFMTARATASDLHAAVSSSFAQAERQRRIPYAASFDYLNREPSVSKVLILSSFVPGYYLNKPYVKPVGVYGEEPLPEGGDLQRILADLHALHVSHVLDVHWPGPPFALPQHNDLHLELQGTSFRLPQPPPNLTLVFEDKLQRVYRVD